MDLTGRIVAVIIALVVFAIVYKAIKISRGIKSLAGRSLIRVVAGVFLIIGLLIGSVGLFSDSPEEMAAQKVEQQQVAVEKAAADKATEELAKKIAADKAAEELAKEAACRTDLQCWGDKYNIKATFPCKDAVERLAKYDVKWTDSWSEVKFPRFRWADVKAGKLEYLGDKIKFQNGFGAWANMIYGCTYDPSVGAVTNAWAQPGRL